MIYRIETRSSEKALTGNSGEYHKKQGVSRYQEYALSYTLCVIYRLFFRALASYKLLSIIKESCKIKLMDNSVLKQTDVIHKLL